MAVSRVSLSSITQGFPKSRSFLDGNSAYIPTSFESIATVTAAGGETSLTFSSIVGTYKALQIRGLFRSSGAGTGTGASYIRFNGDTAANYAFHYLYGDGTSVGASGAASQTLIQLTDRTVLDGNTANIFTPIVIDVQDYAVTSKNKTVRTFTGSNDNTTSTQFGITLSSGLWNSTAAVTSVTIIPPTGFKAGSTFALYGIK